ncbi:hypothetical protein L3Y34_003211 [Caenorhabditis briggsae]|uniref:Uncharacterized protein n=1 Tax=Caenorhabditis briggsae TaxID=6238 RepID=A0AAE9A6V2_CAEBR|nr:hypothetical protein L3Y34_003211 [Caenorhabditis briggsae]
MKPALILFLLTILIFSRCVSSQEPDDDFFSYLKFPNVRNISERFQTNATGFDILEDIQWREEPMDLSDDSANHRHPKNLKNSKPTEQMNIVVSIVITVLLILLLVIVVVLGPFLKFIPFKIIFYNFRHIPCMRVSANRYLNISKIESMGLL